jgi:two-component system sensor histidine kinase PilS (NtrC family)
LSEDLSGGPGPVPPEARVTDRLPARLTVTDPGVRRARALRRKLLWITSLRVAMLLVLIGATAAFTAGTSYSFLELVRNTLTLVALVALVPAALYFPAIFGAKSIGALGVIALVQVAHDCIFSAFLVAATGGTGSAFTFFFSITIVVSGTLLGRTGTIVSAALSTLLLVCLALFETDTLPAPPPLREVLGPVSVESVLYSTGINLVAFVSIGFLSSYLAEALRRSDIQRERYRTNLEDLRQLHESILVSVESGILTCRLDHRILQMNRAAESLLGLEFASARGRNLFDVCPDVRVPILAAQHRFELTRRRRDGAERFLNVTVTPLLARTGEMIGRILVVEDVSTLKRMEARMKADERLATIGKMSAVVAHEIRNPLAAISASAQMLSMATGFREEDRRVLDIVVREADRLNLWITELLDYARPRKGDIVRLDLGELLQQAMDVVRGDPAAARVEVDLGLEEGIRLRGDVQRLHRVFLNLGKNALEAMEGGGLLAVRAWTERDDDGRWAVVSFADNGCGIPPEEVGRVFDAFYTTKPRGTGLGLALVAQVVEEHGGEVSVTSRPGIRTEFRVRLPVS